MQNTSKQQGYVIGQTACSFQFCPRRTTSCSPEGIGNSSKESASAPATCNQTSEPRVDEFIGVYSEHPKISKSYQNQEIRSRTVQHGLYSQAWSIQPSTITTSTYLNHICMAKECKRELVQSNTSRFERTANTMEKQSQGTGPVSRYLRESPASNSRAQSSTIDLLRTGKFSMIFNHVDKHMYLLVSHCHVTSCPTSLIRIPYIGSPQPLHFPHISTGDAQGPPCCSHPTVAMASALRPCPLAFHIMGFVSSREILVEPCCYLCLQF